MTFLSLNLADGMRWARGDLTWRLQGRGICSYYPLGSFKTCVSHHHRVPIWLLFSLPSPFFPSPFSLPFPSFHCHPLFTPFPWLCPTFPGALLFATDATCPIANDVLKPDVLNPVTLLLECHEMQSLISCSRKSTCAESPESLTSGPDSDTKLLGDLA